MKTLLIIFAIIYTGLIFGWFLISWIKLIKIKRRIIATNECYGLLEDLDDKALEAYEECIKR